MTLQLSRSARDLYGIKLESDFADDCRDLVSFVSDYVETRGGVLIRLGGARRGERGYPHMVFAFGGVACAVWLSVGRDLTVEERSCMDNMSRDWCCGVVSDRDGFVEFAMKTKAWRVVTGGVVTYD